MEIQDELIKEVFAQFGAAYYHSEVLHRGLCNVYALATFEKAEDITRPRIEEKFSLAYSLTLGQIIEKTKEILPDNLQQQLKVALDSRNYLAHHFWFERCPSMFSEQGLLNLRQELIEFSDLFAEIDEEIAEWHKTTRLAFGITDDLIQQAFDELIAGGPDESLMSQRPLKKQERLVTVWNVKVGENSTTQIFETKDGCLWQLCDVGLGWTRFKAPMPDWEINENIQRYLPANINPRPSISEPWNYEFQLAKRAVLWVKRGRFDKSYTIGIKAS